MDLRALDAIRDDLRCQHPTWRIWYVPHLTYITWCAQKIPQFAEVSPEHLSKAITGVEQEWRDTAVQARQAADE
jgi:hypothetical protein